FFADGRSLEVRSGGGSSGCDIKRGRGIHGGIPRSFAANSIRSDVGVEHSGAGRGPAEKRRLWEWQRKRPEWQRTLRLVLGSGHGPSQWPRRRSELARGR